MLPTSLDRYIKARPHYADICQLTKSRVTLTFFSSPLVRKILAYGMPTGTPRVSIQIKGTHEGSVVGTCQFAFGGLSSFPTVVSSAYLFIIHIVKENGVVK